jgi:hypothetical protein
LEVQDFQGEAVSDDHSDLVNKDAFEAVEIKFMRGRERYGPDWVGPRPILCCHDEILDALAYIDCESVHSSGLQGECPPVLLDEVAKKLHEALQGVRMMIQIANGEEHGSQDRVEGG